VGGASTRAGSLRGRKKQQRKDRWKKKKKRGSKEMLSHGQKRKKR